MAYDIEEDYLLVYGLIRISSETSDLKSSRN